MIKLAGAFMTIAALGGAGYLWAQVYEKRPAQLSNIEGALQMLETEIVYGATPLPEALQRVGEKCAPDVSGLFRKAVYELNKSEGITAGDAWIRAADGFFPETALNKGDLQIIKRLGAVLGTSDREDQAKHLELTRSHLKLAYAQAESEARKNSKVYRYLGFLGGTLLVLVMY